MIINNNNQTILIKPNQSDFSVPWLDGFLSHQDSNSNSNNLAHGGCHCNHWIVSSVNLITHFLWIGKVDTELSLEIWPYCDFFFSADHRSVWKQQKKPSSSLWFENQITVGQAPKSAPLILTWPLSYSQPELDSYWVTYKSVLMTSQKLQWQYPGLLEAFLQSSLLTR